MLTELATPGRVLTDDAADGPNCAATFNGPHALGGLLGSSGLGGLFRCVGRTAFTQRKLVVVAVFANPCAAAGTLGKVTLGHLYGVLIRLITLLTAEPAIDAVDRGSSAT
jgi:hypothetical protein